MTILAPLFFALALAVLVLGAGIKVLLVAARTVDWDRGGPVVLGVCHRMARRLDVPVRGVRMLTAAATLFTGVVPGIVAYVVAAVILGRGEKRTGEGRPKPQVLGLCADLACRLDVPVDNVRSVVLITTLVTGIVPGMLLYLLAGCFKAVVLPGSRLEARIARDMPSWSRNATIDVPSAGDEIPERIGRYRILGLLGRGGMGSVWRGRDDALGRDAAVKVVAGPCGSEAVRRFGEEARAAAAILSPHIVQIWEYAPDARPPFLAMEYVPGRSAAQLVRAGGPQPVATVLDCARQVLSGLAAAHAAGIVHRDIKPANILLATTGPAAGTYKLTDFGLATNPDRDHSFTATGTLLGTLSYLAPEVALGDDATPSSDLYSLGATLHEMLVGRPPIAAESPLKLLRKLTIESIPPIGSQRPDLPADLAAWLDRLVARDPADRFASADEALRALRGVERFASATTDLDLARTARSDNDIPWHRRPAPGSPSPDPLPTVAPPELLPDIVGRAMAFEADGRDALGEDSILDIARELNIDSAAVRGVLRDRHARSGRGVTGVFRKALGGKESRPDEPAWIADEGKTRGRGGAVRRGAIIGAMIGAFLLPLIVVGTKVVREAERSATIDDQHEATARDKAESFRDAAAAVAPGAGKAEVEATLDSPASQPSEAAVEPSAPAPLPVSRLERSGITLLGLGFIGLATISSIAFGVSLALRALRHGRPARPAGRKWP